MRRNGEFCRLDQNMMDAIAVYMDDKLREELHNEMAPCDPEDFLTAYVTYDESFRELLKGEFDIELDDEPEPEN